MVRSGTEYRDQFRTYFDATLGTNSATKPNLALGPQKTSSLIGLPWPQQDVPTDVPFGGKVWAPAYFPPGHFRPSSSKIGSLPQKPFHTTDEFSKPKVAATVRYLQAPYLSGEMSYGAGIESRPVSSVGTFSLESERQADILAGAEVRMNQRMANSYAWTANRSLRSAPISAPPEPYMTSTNAFFAQRPLADSQQHRLRTYTSSKINPSRSLSSTPSRVPTAPLSGGQALHATRYLAVNDSDGMRRMIEVDTTGAPAAAEVLKLPTTPHPMPVPPAPLSFVPSHPTTCNMDTWGK